MEVPPQEKEGGRATVKTMKLEVRAGPAQRTEMVQAAVPRAGAALGEPRRAWSASHKGVSGHQ